MSFIAITLFKNSVCLIFYKLKGINREWEMFDVGCIKLDSNAGEEKVREGKENERRLMKDILS